MNDSYHKIHNEFLKNAISLFLSFMLLMSLLPVKTAVFASKIKGDENEEYSSKDVYLLCEETERRTEYEKHYITSDGKFIAVTYPEQIHYLDENGEFLDIDCSIKSIDDLFLAEIGDYYAFFQKY